jgi:flagellar capping protein FliD
LSINKDATATSWSFNLWDGASTAGTIAFNCGALTWNGVQLADLSTAQTLTNKTLSDSTTFFADNSDTTKKLQFQISGITTGTTRTVTWPDADGTVALTAGAQTISDKTFYQNTVSGWHRWSPTSSNTGSAYTIFIESTGPLHQLTLTANCTFTISGSVTAGRWFLLMLKQDATGSRTATWPSTVKWPGGTAPTLTTTASRTDLFYFECDGSNWLGRTLGLNYNS